VLRTIRALNDAAFDVLNLHEPAAPGPTATALLIHSAPPVGTYHAAGTSRGYRFLTPLIRRVAERLDRRVVVSKDALALVQGHIGGEYTELFNGVDVASIQAVPARPTEVPTILFCGRHEQRKGLDVLLEAFARLDLDARLWIASDGPDTARLRRSSAGDARIEWLGRISEADKIGRLRAARVFCAPSLGGESFGVVLVEAMAAGAVVVASSLDGYRNVATDGVDAILVEPGDVDDLAAALTTALTDDRLIAPLRTAGHARADHFAMSTLADRYLEIFAELLAD
jgi:phosphatidylinositol alpha-mannosyltransferase